jgi:cytosine/adenosine deaminase-related metal-dependent hydrolase
MVVLIKGGTVIAFDGQEHRLLNDGDVAFEDNRILYVGKNYGGQADEKIDARGKIVTPGLMSMHTHATSMHYLRGVAEDIGSRNFNMSMLPEIAPVTGKQVKLKEVLIAVKAGIIELLKSGSTFFLEMGYDPRQGKMAGDVAQVVMDAGIRSCIVPGYNSGSRVTKDGKSLGYEWDEEKGFKGLEGNIEFIEKCRTNYNGLVTSILGPTSNEHVTENLIIETIKKARELDTRIQIHGCQSVYEWNEMINRYGKTPVKWMNDIGLLTPETMIGHCFYISEHPRTLAPWANDLELLSKSGVTVVHCPTEFARRGAVLHSYNKYVTSGINVTLGVDICPHDMLEEMRNAAHLTKCIDYNCFGGTARQVFDSATVCAAKALGRDDLGVLREGALADIVIVKTNTARMSPMRDPLKNLVFHANSSDVETVIVDGRTVVSEGKVLALDEEKVAVELQKTAERIWENTDKNDWAGRSVDEISPLSVKPYDEE